MSKDITPMPPVTFEQPELFIEAGNRLVPSELAAPSEGAFVAGAIQAIRQTMPDRPNREPSIQERMDQRRRERVAVEREAYLANQEASNETEIEETTISPMALQGRLLLTDSSQETQHVPAERKVAFGRYLKRGIHDVAGEKNTSMISEDETRTMNPEVIAPVVFRARENRRTQKGYFVDDVLLNQVEYRILPRSPRALAVDTHAKTLGQLDVREDSSVLARADRSIEHVFEDKRNAMTEHLEKLTATRSDLDKLSRLVSMPGFAHVGSREMERLLAVAWGEFENLVHVVAVQQKWTPEQVQVAEIALVASFTEGPQNQRVKNFANELRFAKRYAASRIRLFENRLGITRSYLPKSDGTKTA